jgi:hypothetical protein
MLPPHHGELLQWGVSYQFIFGLNLVTQRSLDLSAYVSVQSLTITHWPSYIVHENIKVFLFLVLGILHGVRGKFPDDVSGAAVHTVQNP